VLNSHLNVLEKRNQDGNWNCQPSSEIPAARVIDLPNANHYVFRSNEADVLREVNPFITPLP
jgi:hypothetical protein